MDLELEMSSRRSRRFRVASPVVLGSLGGCSGAPSITFAGAYFPAWLVCCLLGLLAAVVFRVVFVATGLAQVLPMQLFLCLALGALVGVLAWTLWVGL